VKSARSCPGSSGRLGAFEDRYTAALPMEKTSIRPAMVRSPVPCMRTSSACWRGVSLGSLPPGVPSLLQMLADIRDPRDPRGVRHRLVAVLGVAVAATLAGAANYRELGSVAADLPQELLHLLGACWDRARHRFVAPSAATLRRVLIALDADELDAAVGAWLRTHATRDADGWAVALDGKDLRGSWGDDGRLVLFAAMTHRAPGQDAVVLGQIAVPEGTIETTQVRTLLDAIDITGALVTADAAHTCADTARYLVEDCGADYLLTIKGNRPALHAAAIACKIANKEIRASDLPHSAPG